MAIHGLALLKPEGWQPAVRRAADWLMSVQKDGHWSEPAMPDPVFLTVLVLDAIVLATGQEQPLTFSRANRADEIRAPERQKRRFRVALSFPGEVRPLVKRVALQLSKVHGKDAVFYDEHFKSELARPNLDLYLQSIYAEHSDLVAVFVCADYERKEWCGLEWRAVRELIKRKESDRVMFLRVDDMSPDGMFSIDGYIDCRQHTPNELAAFISERIQLSARPSLSSETTDVAGKRKRQNLKKS